MNYFVFLRIIVTRMAMWFKTLVCVQTLEQKSFSSCLYSGDLGSPYVSWLYTRASNRIDPTNCSEINNLSILACVSGRSTHRRKHIVFDRPRTFSLYGGGTTRVYTWVGMEGGWDGIVTDVRDRQSGRQWDEIERGR